MMLEMSLLACYDFFASIEIGRYPMHDIVFATIRKVLELSNNL